MAGNAGIIFDFQTKIHKYFVNPGLIYGFRGRNHYDQAEPSLVPMFVDGRI